MNFSGRTVGLLLTVTLVGGSGLACKPASTAPAPQARRPPPPPNEDELRGRLAEAPDADLLASARERLAGGGRLENCGPYPLYTDIQNVSLISTCGRLADRLDEVYEARYGLRPRGEPASAIVLFGSAEAYRDFAREGGVPVGYAGYALAARGLAVFHASDTAPTEDFLATLMHELTHLVNRRALGVNLPPWLSEGLADGIGDTATPSGFDPIDGISGLEALAKRLRQARIDDRAGDLARLVTLGRGEFDRGVVS